jgi:hypothetical protein
VRTAGQCAPVGKCQSLGQRLLVNSQHQRAVRRIEIEPDDLGRLGGKVRIVALAPVLTGRKVDLLGAQETPDMLYVDVTQFRRDPANRAAGHAIRHVLVERAKPSSCARSSSVKTNQGRLRNAAHAFLESRVTLQG